MADAKKGSNIFQFALIFLAVYLGSQFLLPIVFPSYFGKDKDLKGVFLTVPNVRSGLYPTLTINNKTSQALSLPSRCPAPPVQVFSVQNPGETTETVKELTTDQFVTTCDSAPIVVAAGTTAHVSLAPWMYSLFGTTGAYEVRLPMTSAASGSAVAAVSGSGVAVTTSGAGLAAPQVIKARFAVTEPGVFTKLFRTFITAPLLNALIFIASLMPGHNLGLAIILITILVKLVLYIPTKHALEGQKKMQLLQPKLEALKKKYPGDQKKQQEETMKLWAEHKINPLQSCLPTLIQFPILIGLYYTVRDGSHLEYSHHLLYPLYQNLGWTFGTGFLGLDLLKPNYWLLPPLLVILQFLQMKLAFAIQKRKSAKDKKAEIIDIGPDGKKEKEPASPQDIQQKVMLYGLPLMIGFFAIQFPAAVSIYWGISTLFGIGQQILVNREHLTVR